MALVCKWEIKGTSPTVSGKSTTELDDIAKKVDNQLDEMFESGSSSYNKADDILREAEAGARYEQALAKKQGIPYIERQIAAAGIGQLSAQALRIARMADIFKKGKVPVEGDYGIYEYTQKELDKTTPRVPSVPSPRVPSTTSTPRMPYVPTVTPRVPSARVPRTPTPEPRTPYVPETPRIPTPEPRVPRTPTDRIPRVPRVPRTPADRVPRTPGIPRVPATPAIPVLPVPSLKGDKSKSRYPMDSFAWKQGFGWWVSMPPYSGTIGKDMVFTRTKPAGVPIGRTPTETVTKLGINVPKGNLLDLGIMDISIKKKGSKISYKRDVKQKTKLGSPVGVPPGIQYARGR